MLNPDFGFSSIYAGAAQDNWANGVTCDDKFQCKIENDANCNYNGSTMACKSASAAFRFGEPSDAPEKGFGDRRISFNLMQGDMKNWKYGNTGVLGMSPVSPIWNYIRTAYKGSGDYTEVSLYYQYKNKDNMYFPQNDTLAD